MDKTEAPAHGLANADTGGLMQRLTAQLGEIAAAVAGVSETSSPAIELLEASRAIQSALVSLSNWDGSHDERGRTSGAGAATVTLRDAWIAFRPHDPWDRLRSTSLDA
ncbi:MAG TPA: hypothetical protein VG412_07335 [Acidimicrobiales bacterium]|nr:hypothetical protein [Acidimicrobiales bacterium]